MNVVSLHDTLQILMIELWEVCSGLTVPVVVTSRGVEEGKAVEEWTIVSSVQVVFGGGIVNLSVQVSNRVELLLAMGYGRVIVVFPELVMLLIPENGTVPVVVASVEVRVVEASELWLAVGEKIEDVFPKG